MESILRHDPYAKLFILCLDRKTFNLCSEFASDKITLVSLKTLEEEIPELLFAKSNRTITEYYWTLTPCIIYYLIFRIEACSTLTYLDADQYFYSNPQSIFHEIGDANVAIMPHRFPNELEGLNIHGKFNVSWLTFRNTEEANTCLKWWMTSCIEWCYAKVDGHRYGDQKYLDQFPLKFRGIHEIQHQGCGLAPWNLSTFKYDCEIILFHFQSFRIRSPYTFTAVIHLVEKCNLKKFKEKILKQYLFSLKKCFYRINNGTQESASDKSMGITKDSLVIFYIYNKVFFIRNKLFRSLLTSLNSFNRVVIKV
tara:strand:+ start:1199 stop:2128 length:930 start_codon:yes stop_codon:yes gene_type:complete